jgi:hypothetical protein
VSEAAKSDCGKKQGQAPGGASDGTDGTDDSGASDDDSSDDQSSGDSGSADHSGPSGDWTPPGQAKKDESTGGAPGNSGNAPGHNK